MKEKQEQKGSGPGVALCGINVRIVSQRKIFKEVSALFSTSSEESYLLRITTLNPDFLLRARRCKVFRTMLNASDMHIADGVGVVLAMRLRGVRVAHYAGADLFFALLDMAQREGWRVHFFCRADGLSRWRDVRVALAQRYPQLHADGEDVACADICCSARSAFWRRGALTHNAAQSMPAPLSLCDTKSHVPNDSHYVLCRTKSAKKHSSQNACMSERCSVFEALQQVESTPVPTLYFANFGAPEQEVFLDALRDAGARGVAIGVGGAFDFLTGAVARAPRWVRALRMEWLWRTVHQPKRIGKMLRSVVVFPVVMEWEYVYKLIKKKNI